MSATSATGSSPSSPATSSPSCIQVDRIEVMRGDVIDKFDFCFSDGTVKAYGSKGGAKRPDFVLEKGEYIVKITAEQGDYYGHYSLHNITFFTNSGRASQEYGTGKHNSNRKMMDFEVSDKKRKQIVGVKRGFGCCPAIIEIIEEDANFAELFWNARRIVFLGRLKSAEGSKTNELFTVWNVLQVVAKFTPIYNI